MKKVGRIDAIVRHPVKALRGESLTECSVDQFGLYGDRINYFGDATKAGRPISPDKCPSFIEYSATLVGEGSQDAYPAVEITSPAGNRYRWGDEQFFAEMQQAAGNLPIVTFSRTPAEGGENWDGHILIVTDASLREVARAWGKGEVDHRRFRANLVIALDEDIPFQENEWLGKQLRIGDILLQVNSRCERCHAINIEPSSYQIDTSLLKTVAQKHEGHFGVYASVIQTGKVGINDEVHIVESAST